MRQTRQRWIAWGIPSWLWTFFFVTFQLSDNDWKTTSLSCPTFSLLQRVKYWIKSIPHSLLYIVVEPKFQIIFFFFLINKKLRNSTRLLLRIFQSSLSTLISNGKKTSPKYLWPGERVSKTVEIIATNIFEKRQHLQIADDTHFYRNIKLPNINSRCRYLIVILHAQIDGPQEELCQEKNKQFDRFNCDEYFSKEEEENN